MMTTWILLPLSLTLAALACTAASPQLSGQTPAQEKTPQHGGTVLLAARELAPNLLMLLPGNRLGTTTTVTPIYQTLLSLDYKPDEDFRHSYRVVPLLAESWDMPDQQTDLFRIRRGVKWHDGKELTAADVAWSYQWLRDPANRFPLAASLVSADRIDAVDSHTLRITTKGTAPNLLRDLTGGGIGLEPSIHPQHVFEREKSLEKTAVGTGPFKLESWDPRSGATLIRNQDYWEPGRPYLDRIKIVYGVDAAGTLAAFRAQQNDVVKFSDKPQFDSLHVLVPDAPWQSSAQQYADYLVPRIDRPPFDDVRVRRAMHLAIDRKTMVDTISFGEGIPSPPGINGARAGWAISPEELGTLPGYRQPKEQDRSEARRLLAEAGHPNGLKTSIKFTSSHSRHPAEAQFLAEELRRVGIQAELLPVEDAVMGKARIDGTFELALDNSEFLPHRDWSNNLHSKGQTNPGIKDAELDRLIESYLQEMDEAKQRQIVLQVQRLLLAKDYVIPTITQMGFFIWQPYLHGFVENRGGQVVNKAWPHTWVEVDKLPAGR